MNKGDLKFMLNNEATFNVCKTMKQPTDMRVVSRINYLMILEAISMLALMNS